MFSPCASKHFIQVSVAIETVWHLNSLSCLNLINPIHCSLWALHDAPQTEMRARDSKYQVPVLITDTVHHALRGLCTHCGRQSHQLSYSADCKYLNASVQSDTQLVVMKTQKEGKKKKHLTPVCFMSSVKPKTCPTFRLPVIAQPSRRRSYLSSPLLWILYFSRSSACFCRRISVCFLKPLILSDSTEDAFRFHIQAATHNKNNPNIFSVIKPMKENSVCSHHISVQLLRADHLWEREPAIQDRGTITFSHTGFCCYLTLWRAQSLLTLSLSEAASYKREEENIGVHGLER